MCWWVEMENIKVLIQSQNDIDYCADLFFKMGYRKGISTLHGSIWIASFNYDGDMYSSTSDHTLPNHKQLTIEQLRDLVHAKKNSENEKEMNILDEGRYVEKEYINKTTGEYRKTADVVSGEQWIEVPNGAEIATSNIRGVGFYKDYAWYDPKKCTWDGFELTVKDLIRSNVIWQRQSAPASLNDQCEEIEKVRQAIKVKSGSDSDHSLDAMSFGVMGVVEDASNARKQTVEATLAERQSTYGCFEDVAFVTEGIMDLITKVRPNGLRDIPIPHRMALYMIASKIARLANGDINHLDSWHDIGGYSKLIENLIGEEK